MLRPMTPEWHVEVTRDTVRVVVAGLGVVSEEPAVVVVIFGARSWARVLTAGEEARVVETSGFDPVDTARVTDDSELFLRPARLEDAPWWREDAGTDFDPWDHNGEYVVVWPFRPDTYAPAIGAALVRYVAARALSSEGVKRSNPLLRFWLLLRPPRVRLAELPPTGEQHLALGGYLAPLQFEAGSAPAPPPPRRLAELSWQQWAVLAALPVIFLMKLAFDTSRHHPPVPAVLVLILAGCAWVSITLAASFRARGERDDLSRENVARRAARRAELRRFEVLPPGGEGASGHLGAASFRLGGPSIAVLGIFILTSLLAGRLAPPVVHLVAPAMAAATLLKTILLTSVLLGFLGGRLFSASLTLGERGITLRTLGLFRRPMFVPFSSIRSVVFLSTNHLSIRLVEGDDLDVPVRPLPDFWRAKQLGRAAEEAILARLGAPRRYRMPAGSAAGGPVLR